MLATALLGGLVGLVGIVFGWSFVPQGQVWAVLALGLLVVLAARWR